MSMSSSGVGARLTPDGRSRTVVAISEWRLHSGRRRHQSSGIRRERLAQTVAQEVARQLTHVKRLALGVLELEVRDDVPTPGGPLLVLDRLRSYQPTNEALLRLAAKPRSPARADELAEVIVEAFESDHMLFDDLEEISSSQGWSSLPAFQQTADVPVEALTKSILDVLAATDLALSPVELAVHLLRDPDQVIKAVRLLLESEQLEQVSEGNVAFTTTIADTPVRVVSERS